MVISVGVLILKHFLLGGLPQQPVDEQRIWIVGGLRRWVFITGEGESKNKGKQIWSYEERR